MEKPRALDDVKLPDNVCISSAQARFERVENTLEWRARRKGWMRNMPCMCGSGMKFKACCWEKPVAQAQLYKSKISRKK